MAMIEVRPTKDELFLTIAAQVATRTTCIRKGVGCVLTNSKGHIIGTGYNGVAAGLPHCNEEHPCEGCDLPPGQDKCEAIHAEVNAVLQCHNVHEIDTVYCTLAPCVRCAKMLLNTSAKRIVFSEHHANYDGLTLWNKAGRTWIRDA